MKPTQEQVIAWAQEAGFDKNSLGWTFTHGKLGEGVERAIALAYEAGRKDENEACDEIAAWILKMPENDVSAAIRARMNHDN